MATGLTVVKRALRLIRVIGASETPTADQSSDAIESLNAMMARWQRDGVGIAYTPMTDSADTLYVQDEALAAVAFNLAVEIAPEYGVNPSPVVASMADAYYKAVLRDSVGWVHADLGSMPGTSDTFDINSGV